MPTSPVLAAVLASAVLPVGFGHGTAVVGAGPHALRLRVEVARTQAQLERGLMYRRSVPPGTGMVFLFPHDEQPWFWMKDTFVPLQIAFFDDRGRIVQIDAMTPCRTARCPHVAPRLPARGALEVARGTLTRAGVRVGERQRVAIAR